MGVIYSPRSYEIQPPNADGLNPNFPDPSILILPSVGARNLSTGKELVKVSSPSFGYGALGVRQYLGGPNGYYELDTGHFSTGLTILCVCQRAAADAATVFTSSTASSAQHLGLTAGGGIYLSLRGVVNVIAAPDGTLSADKSHVLCLSLEGATGNGVIYVDGMLVGTCVGAGLFWDGTDSPLWGAGYSGFENQHFQYLFAKWNDGIPFDHARELSANPWQLFTERRFAAQAAGGGGGVISTNLFHDASGQLVIAASLPPGGSTITDPTTTTLADVAPWMRGLDATDAALWHPAKYYSGGPETTVPIPGGNLMPNADLSFGADYWEVLNNAGGGTNYSGPTRDLSDNVPAGSHSVGVSRSGTTQAASDVFDIVYNKRINVLPSTRYEMSAYMAATNCTPSIFPKFYKLVGGVETAVSSSDIFTTTAAAGGDDLSEWNRAGGFFTTPADAQYVKFCIRGSAASAADPVFWASKLFIGQAYPGQTELSPWVAGGNSGAFGELESLTSSHDEYVSLISVSPNTDTEIISKTFTSVISPTRARRVFLSFFCEGSSYTRKVLLDISSGSYTDQKTIYNSASRTDTRILTFMTIITIPPGYDDDITISITVRHDYESARDFEQLTLSLLEIPS